MKLKGRIINIVSNLFFVEAAGRVYECSSRGIFKTKDLKPVVGDNVWIEVEHNKGNIVEVVDRITYLKRPKIANLTQLILVVSASHPVPDLLMLDKQLAFAAYIGITPIIVVNKIDLDQAKANEIKKIYSAVGYQVILTNAKEQKHIQELKKVLKNHINVFSGNSGVGKSTLINALFKSKQTIEGEISHKNKKGKNTTTSVKLYPIEENTYIADTPGFSNFDIYEIPYRELAQYFVEFNQYFDQCEYQDCTHMKEKTCGIKEEVGKKIATSRYQNFQKIYEELKDQEEHKW